MIFFAALTLVILIVLLLSFYTYRIVFFAPKSSRNTIDDPLLGPQYDEFSEHIYRISHIMEKIPCETVRITAFDGCNLYGRFYHVSDEAPLEILFHGYRSCAFRDCSGYHALSRKMGFNTLVVDQRAHGNSGGRTISFGIKEHRDCMSWIQYATDRFGCETPIILAGLSMGAATVLMVTKLDLPQTVSCIIADSPYASPSAIIEKVCADMHYPVTLCRPFIRLGALLFGRFHLDSISAKEAIQNARIPILLIHGEDDRLVPCTMSFEIARHCQSPIAVETFPGAGHGLSYLVDPLRYECIIYRFLQTVPVIANKIINSFPEQFF